MENKFTAYKIIIDTNGIQPLLLLKLDLIVSL